MHMAQHNHRKCEKNNYLMYTEWSVHGGNTICGLVSYQASVL